MEFGGPDKEDLLQFLFEEGADLGGVMNPHLKLSGYGCLGRDPGDG